MLPRGQRLTAPHDFASTIRTGRRAGGPVLVVHVAATGLDETRAAGSGAGSGAGPGRAGFVVSRAVGHAVVRNRVRRRLRHLVAERGLLDGELVVVRALPAAADATYAELRGELDRCLQRVHAGVRVRPEPTGAEVTR